MNKSGQELMFMPSTTNRQSSTYDPKNWFNLLIRLTLFKSEGSVVSVLGAVQNPGTFEIFRPLSVIDALALASGPSNDAALRRAVLISVKGNKVSYKKINCRSFLNGKSNSSPIIEAGQVLYVPRRGFSVASEAVQQIGKMLLIGGLTIDIGRYIR